MSGFERVKPDPGGREGAWLPLARDYAVAMFRRQAVIRATLHGHLTVDSPEVLEAVEAWEGEAYVHEDDEGVELILVRPPPDEATRWWLHGLLLAATMVTTLMSGALMMGIDPMGTSSFRVGTLWIPYPTEVDLGRLLEGAPFAFPFVGVLLAHEMGHYAMALRHRIRATPPYFIPFPAYFSVVGSLGAFIRIKGPIVRRSVLLDIGAAGPVASFLTSVPLVIWGLSMSQTAPGSADVLTPFVVPFAGEALWVGNSLAMSLLALPVLPDGLGVHPVVLHPAAFAGWLGLFVTALNLLPMGQLDGGHILHALEPRWQARAGRLFLLSLLPLGFMWWGWWVWAVAAVLVNRGRMRHPPVLQPAPDPDGLRRAVAWFCIICFFLTFVPVPLRF
ncbi:MAG TPA: site-2 protease family protein [Longimicrobiales bacterium]|jgi:Zn-dependent protease